MKGKCMCKTNMKVEPLLLFPLLIYVYVFCKEERRFGHCGNCDDGELPASLYSVRFPLKDGIYVQSHPQVY